ncbi:MAG: hypothetical protein EOP07_23555 [Proteobacteria bacterium]|nr:MAG: hypothetical protein EOP07_23555 [Pseudomonadota bacterium]
MNVSIQKLCLTTFLLLSFHPLLQAAESETKKAEVEPMGTFEKMNFMRKMISPGLDLKNAGEAVEKANKQIEAEFTLEKVDEAKVKVATGEAKKAMGSLVAAMKNLFAVMSEFITPERIAQMKEAEAKKPKVQPEIVEDKDEALQIPASFSPEQIKKIRATKAKNLPRVDAIKASIDFKKMDFMPNLMTTSDEEKNKILVKIEESGTKSIDLEVEEYTEMRGYLSGSEMKTFFTLQDQVKAKKQKAREEKMEAMKKAKAKDPA